MIGKMVIRCKNTASFAALALIVICSDARSQSGLMTDDFSTGLQYGWINSNGAFAHIENGKLLVALTRQSSGKYRGDIITSKTRVPARCVEYGYSLKMYEITPVLSLVEAWAALIKPALSLSKGVFPRPAQSNAEVSIRSSAFSSLFSLVSQQRLGLYKCLMNSRFLNVKYP